ncbi:MAG: hypothetical protein CME71_11840 [Halobacteriovorax sp.]|mgnify:CR=1 FL=1|nr:hypothetical protein [Halobacteriovorax sp.]
MVAFRSSDLLQTNFAAGEIDSEMQHRTDVGAYGAAVGTLINFLPRLHGGVRTKPGTIFHQELIGDVKLFPFIFSEEQAYIMAFSTTRLDIYHNDGTVAVSNITTPYSSSQWQDIKLVQSGDVAIICHPDVVTQKLTRTGASAFSLSTFSFDAAVTGALALKHVPFYRFADSDITLTPGSAGSGSSHTLTASAALFTSNHVGVRFRHKGKQMLITAVGSGTSATATNQEALENTDAETDWDEEVFSSERGFPGCVCFHDQRLCFGGSASKRSGIWLSQTGQFFNFDAAEGLDDEAIWSGVDDDRVQQVRHLLSHGHLQIFCDDTEAFVPETATKPITPENFAIRSQTRYGILDRVPPEILDEGTIYAQRFGQGIREFMFTDLTQRYNADLVSVLDARAINDPVSMTTVPASPDRPEMYTYIVMADGTIAVLHSLRSEKIVAWARWQATNSLYKQVINVLGRVFVSVRRTINSATKYYLEEVSYDTTLESAKVVTASATATFTGLAHLEGELVHAVKDNISPIGTGTVSSGSVTFPETTTNPHIGIHTDSTFTTLPIEFTQDPSRTSIRRKRIAQAVIGVKDGIAIKAGSAGALHIWNVDSDFSLDPVAKTQRVRVFPTGYNDDATLSVTASVPVPITILSLACRIAY